MIGHNLVPNLMDGYDVNADQIGNEYRNLLTDQDDKEFGWRGTRFKCANKLSVVQTNLEGRNILTDTDDKELGWRGTKFKLVEKLCLNFESGYFDIVDCRLIVDFDYMGPWRGFKFKSAMFGAYMSDPI